MIVLGIAAAWLLLSMVVATWVGRAIRIADGETHARSLRSEAAADAPARRPEVRAGQSLHFSAN